MNNPNICYYGCGKEALYYFPTVDKWCCSPHAEKCEAKRILRRIFCKPNLIKLKKKCPEIFDVEELREVNGNIEARCKFCKKWFTPKNNEIRARVNCIKKKIGQINCYFFCSQDCKDNSPYYKIGIKNDPFQNELYNRYSKEVWRLTRITIRNQKLENLDLRGKKFKKSLDHKFSIYEGFMNYINPRIIANVNNLEIVNEDLNQKKQEKCAMTKEELLNTYKSN